MFACTYFRHTCRRRSCYLFVAHLAVHIPDICTAESTYNQYGQCLAGCNGLYVRSSHPCALHCIARVSLRQRLSVPTTDAQRAGQTGSAFVQEKASLTTKQSIQNPRASLIHSPRELVGPCRFTRYRLLSRRGSLSLSDLSSLKTETVVDTSLAGKKTPP